MTESQLSICTWADATLGPPVSDASIAACALKEMAELVTACVYNEPAEQIAEEIADVVIVLARLGRSVWLDVIETSQENASNAATSRHQVQWFLQQANAGLHQMLIDLPDVECARIWLGGCARLLGILSRKLAVDLPAAIDRKMAINRSRQWTRDGNGHGRHTP